MRLKTTVQSVFRDVYGLLAKSFLRRIPGMWRISNFLFRIVWRDIRTIEIEGSKMWIDVNEPAPALRKTFQAYGLNLIHEEATTALFKKVVKPGNVVLDLGANMGYFTLLAARLVGESGKVFAFEPEPKNFNYLKRNIDLNGYSNVEAIQKAVSSKKGKTKLFICSYDSGHHTIEQCDGIEVYSQGKPFEKNWIEIDTVALDEFLEDKTEKVDTIKMDVEGAEALAVLGMRNILRNNKKIKLFIEYFPIFIEKMGSSPRELIESLIREFEFNIYVIGHDYSMEDYEKTSHLRIGSYQELTGFLRNSFSHVNLYVTRESCPK